MGSPGGTGSRPAPGFPPGAELASAPAKPSGMSKTLSGPQVPGDLRSFRELWKFADWSLTEARRANREFELEFEPDIRFGRRTVSSSHVQLALLADILRNALWVACFFTAVFTHGVTLAYVFCAALGAEIVYWPLKRRYLVPRARWRRELRVYPAALIQAHEPLFAPPDPSGGSEAAAWGLVVTSERDDMASRPLSLLELGRWVLDLREARIEYLSADQLRVREFLRRGEERSTGEVLELPETVVGVRGVYLAEVLLRRDELPRGFLDRRIWFVARRPGSTETPVILPASLWWHPSNDDLVEE